MIGLDEVRTHHHTHPTVLHQRNGDTEQMIDGQTVDARVISEGMINKNDVTMDKGTVTFAVNKEGQTPGRTRDTLTQGETTLAHTIIMEDKIIHLPDIKKGAVNRTDGKPMNAAMKEDQGTN